MLRCLTSLLMGFLLIGTAHADDFADFLQKKGPDAEFSLTEGCTLYQVKYRSEENFQNNAFSFFNQFIRDKDGKYQYLAILQFEKPLPVQRIFFKLNSGEINEQKAVKRIKPNSYKIIQSEQVYRFNFIDNCPTEIILLVVDEMARISGKNVPPQKIVLTLNEAQVNALQRMKEFHLANSADHYVPGTYADLYQRNEETLQRVEKARAEYAERERQQKLEEQRRREAEQARWKAQQAEKERAEKERKERERQRAEAAERERSNYVVNSVSLSSSESPGTCAECAGKGTVSVMINGKCKWVRCNGCNGTGKANRYTDYIDSNGVRHRSQADQDLAHDVFGNSGGAAGTFMLR